MRKSFSLAPLAPAAAAVAIAAVAATAPPAAYAQDVEWRSYGSDAAGTKYSPLDQINRETIGDLQIVWRQSVLPEAMREGREDFTPPVASQNTPLMADGRLYISSALGTVAALDARTGEVLWFDTPPDRDGEPFTRVRQTRGVAYWDDPRSDDARVLAVVGSHLVALNARTGERYPDFGDGGEVDLRRGFDRPVETFGWGSAPLVVGDIVVIGSAITDVTNPTMPAMKEMPPGDVRAFDVRTGEQVWIFHVIPREGEPGNETWLTALTEDRASWEYSGNTNMWAWPSADEELGYVYVPLSTPTNDYYGGYRPGDNLFAESIVCLDARTGDRVWHFQAVHHGIWDYDFPAAPNVIDLRVEGRAEPVKAVAAVSKQAFTYVFDRVTGEPVWPIEERPVPPGDVPGEWYAPTQPFPTRPPPFDQQGTTVDDLIDFTAELRRDALEVFEQVCHRPALHAAVAGGRVPRRYEGHAADAGRRRRGRLGRLGGRPGDRHPVRPIGAQRGGHRHRAVRASRSDMRLVVQTLATLEGPNELPLFKPPYGRLVAIDLKRGEILWSQANGDGPRDHPLLANLDLPPLGQPGRVSPLVTKSFVFLGEGGNAGVVVLQSLWGGAGGKMFRAYDKLTGDVVWEMELPGGTTAAPMTYMVDGKQYIVVTVGWEDMPSEYIALALPE